MRTVGAVAVLLVLALGCTGPDGAATPDVSPLAGFGPCPSPPAATDVASVPGLSLPDGAVVRSVSEQGPITQVQGFVPTTPVAVRDEYLALEGITILLSEDEVVESEILFTDGDHRIFVKAQAVCSDGSDFVAVVAPESAAGAVPTPAGGG